MKTDFPFGLLIAGTWRETNEDLPVANPYDESVIGRVAVASADDVAAAVSAAESGASVMRELPAHERSRILSRAADTVSERTEDFTRTIALEAGKPVRYARAEVRRAIQTLRFAAEEAKRIHGETIPMDAAVGSENRRGFFIRQPLGVIAAITPFNFPLNLVCHKVAPALAAGNSVVLKPATATPLTALRLAEVLLEAGLPPAALSVITGTGATAGVALVRDERVRMITFTGSAEVGEAIRSRSGLRRVALELGSNSGAIVGETADFDSALERCLVGGFAYSGQVCIHTQRLYIHSSLVGRFVDLLARRARELVCGDPLLEDTEVGPMIDRAALERGLALVEEARRDGARVRCGGSAEGTIMLPTVITGVDPDMKVVCEEAFAPTVTVESFDDFGDALAMFNRGSAAGTHAYGLAVGVFTRDVNRALQAAERLDAGNVYVNDSATFRVDHQPYGGVRDSGMGREGPRFAIEEMTELKTVTFNLAP